MFEQDSDFFDLRVQRPSSDIVKKRKKIREYRKKVKEIGETLKSFPNRDSIDNYYINSITELSNIIDELLDDIDTP